MDGPPGGGLRRLPSFFLSLLACSGGGETGAANESPLPSVELPRLCAPPGRALTSEEVGLVRVFTEVRADSLVGMVWEPSGDGFIVLDQRGMLVRHDADGGGREVLLDWRDRVFDPWAKDAGEAGLIGLALHPQWPTDGRAYVSAVLREGVPEECPLQVIAELQRRPGAPADEYSLDPQPVRLLMGAT